MPRTWHTFLGHLGTNKLAICTATFGTKKDGIRHLMEQRSHTYAEQWLSPTLI